MNKDRGTPHRAAALHLPSLRAATADGPGPAAAVLALAL